MIRQSGEESESDDENGDGSDGNEDEEVENRTSEGYEDQVDSEKIVKTRDHLYRQNVESSTECIY